MKTTKPNLAVLDGDIIAYKAAAWADIEGVDELEGRLNSDVERWVPETCTDFLLTFSCNRKDNFRREHLKSYKAHREGTAQPDCLEYAKELLEESYRCRYVPRLEADDLMGIAASSGKAIAITIDKDLKGVPGWHFNPDKDSEVRYISEEEADRFFAQQIISGDSTDGIPGLPGKGIKFFEKEILRFDYEDWFQEIWWAFEEHGYSMDYFLQQARCVRILRDGEYSKENQSIHYWTPEFAQ
jgi:5'-3' exonuclease